MNGRVDPFAALGPDEKLDLKQFKPLKRPEKVNPQEIRKVAEQSSFPSREPVTTPPPQEPTERRLYRTGRNVQFSCKVTQELHDEIYALTDDLAKRMEEKMPGMRWTVGMTVDRMVAALKKEMANE